jgi:hypothetical protein
MGRWLLNCVCRRSASFFIVGLELAKRRSEQRNNEAPPLAFLFHPDFALHVTGFAKLGREAALRE